MKNAIAINAPTRLVKILAPGVGAGEKNLIKIFAPRKHPGVNAP
jgi:hypothetical protein